MRILIIDVEVVVLLVNTIVCQMGALLIQALQTVWLCGKSDQTLFVDVRPQTRFKTSHNHVDS